MTPRRFAPWCLALACLLAALLPAPAQKKDKLPVLKVRIYGSVLTGYSKTDAKAFTEPMVALIGRNLGLSTDLDLVNGRTAAELFAFGKKLQDGEYHLGVVWGIEYGWLREKYPNLKPHAVVTEGVANLPNRTLLLVHKDSPFKTLADLKGKRLAVSKDLPLMDRVSIPLMLRNAKLDPKEFFVPLDPLGTVRQAAVAVKNEKADCVAMAASVYFRLKELQPGLANQLVELKAGEVYQEAVLIGSPDVVNRLRKGLWGDLQAQFLSMHHSTEGKDCLNFWHVQGFVTPDAAFARGVEASARKFPAEVLLTLD